MHLASIIAKDGDGETDVTTRLVKERVVFRRLDNMWKSSSLSVKIKLHLYSAIVVSRAIYASETLKSTKRIQNK